MLASSRWLTRSLTIWLIESLVQRMAQLGPSASSCAAVTLRRYDEEAKIKDLPTPPVAHFMTYVAQCLRQVA